MSTVFLQCSHGVRNWTSFVVGKPKYFALSTKLNLYHCWKKTAGSFLRISVVCAEQAVQSGTIWYFNAGPLASSKKSKGCAYVMIVLSSSITVPTSSAHGRASRDARAP